MRAILRTHGGVGNQIFQVLYGRLFADAYGAEVAELHDDRYAHKFSRSTELRRFDSVAGVVEERISALRIPKIAKKVFGRRKEAVRILGVTYIDGYFQTPESFREFSRTNIADHVGNLRAELRIHGAAVQGGVLHHFRLGDFFASPEEAKRYTLDRLTAVEEGATIISNQELIFEEPEVAKMLYARNCRLRSTVGMTAEQIVRLMCEYKVIHANESTLTFWASVLGGCQVSFKTRELRETRNLLLGLEVPALGDSAPSVRA